MSWNVPAMTWLWLPVGVMALAKRQYIQLILLQTGQYITITVTKFKGLSARAPDTIILRMYMDCERFFKL